LVARRNDYNLIGGKENDYNLIGGKENDYSLIGSKGKSILIHAAGGVYDFRNFEQV
jgi:hypothetical protein